MTRSHLLSFRSIMYAALVCVYVTIIAPRHANAEDPVGHWTGVLNAGPTTLTIVVKITRADDGTLAGTMDSPDQGAVDLPIESVTFEEGVLTLTVAFVGGSYTGTLGEDGVIAGTWSQSGYNLPLNLERTNDAPKLNRPQEPAPPFPYESEDVVFDNPEAAGVTIAGTLTLPDGPGTYPVVVLITGSGPQDRDEAIFGHRPFLVLADYMTRRGIAVLRCDDRGVGESTGDRTMTTTADYATDVVASIDYLKTRPEIDRKQIGLIGHSEGGLIAGMVAAATNDVAFVVLMASPGVNGTDVMLVQGDLMGRAAGVPEWVLTRQRAVKERAYPVLASNEDEATVKEQLLTIYREELGELTPSEQSAMGYSEDVARREIESLTQPWLRYFMRYDPAGDLKRVRVPVLVLNGELDLQVSPEQNLPAIDSALKSGGNSDVTIVEFPSLNHLFQTATTGALSEYGAIEETIAPTVLETIGDWLDEQTGG